MTADVAVIVRTLPLPLPPVAYAGFCRCPCHDMVEADHQADNQHGGHPTLPRVAINGLGALAVRCDRPDDAASACDRCRPYHCPALLNDVPEIKRWLRGERMARSEDASLVFGQGDGDEG